MWLHVPGLSCPSAQVEECLRKESKRRLPRKLVPLWVTLSGNQAQRQLWWIGWKTRAWMKRLYGTISRRFLSASTAIKWISSLPDIHANHSHAPAEELAEMIQDIYGHTSIVALRKSNQGSASSRTLLGICPWGSEKFGKTWGTWGSGLRQDCLQRQKLAQATKEKDSSYSLWPKTPAACDGEGGILDVTRGTNAHFKLRDYAAAWPTPRCQTGGPEPDHRHGPGLVTVADKWRTPMGTDADHGGPNARDSDGTPHLTNQTANWATPQGDADSRGGSKGSCMKTLQAEIPDFSRQVPEILDGKSFSDNARRLNPRFVEWLMGWPVGWVTASVLPGMVSCHFRQRLRSSLLQVILRSSK